MIDKNGDLDLSEFEIESKTGKFLVRSNATKYAVVEVNEGLFKSYLSTCSKSIRECTDTNSRYYSKLKNNMDFMLEQLTEDTVFNLQMMSGSWTYNTK